MSIHIGIGGWTYEPWRGTFYPPKHPQKRELEYAGQHLTGIEINGTYYGSQKPESFANWAASVPDGFKFSVKASRFTTNRKVLAEGAEVWRGLVEISRNRALSRGLRESATGWLGREALTTPSATGEIVTTLRQLAEDREESAGLRTRAVRSIARLDGQATAALVSLADANDPVISRAAFQSLGRSADPRARDALRRKVREGTIPEGSRKAAIEALGGRDAVAADFTLLREIWPRLTDEASREGVINALAEAGGAENLRWLLAQSADSQMSASDRARAIRGAVRAGATTADLIRLYDAGQDRRVKDALIEAMGRIGDRAAVDKLIQIAREDTDPQIRRRAVNRLSKSSDERAIAALKAMVER